MSHVIIVSQARVNHVFVSQLLCHGNCYYCKQLASRTTDGCLTFHDYKQREGLCDWNGWNLNQRVHVLGALFSRKFRPCPHVSAYFWIRNFFSPDTASVHTTLANPAYESTFLFFKPLSGVEILLILSNFYHHYVRLFVFYTKTYI